MSLEPETPVNRRRPPARRSRTLRRRDPAGTRLKLLEAAIREFARSGLEGARVDQIAARAGTNKQLVYHYFGNKEKLYTAALEECYGRFRAREANLSVDKLEPNEAIAKLVTRLLDSVLALREEVTIITDENMHRARHVRGSDKIRLMHMPVVAELEGILQRGEKGRVFRSGIDPILLFISILGLCTIYVSNRHTLSAVFGRDLLQPRELRNWRAHIAEFILKALRI